MANEINCPECGHSFEVQEALSGKLEQQYREKLNEKLAEAREEAKQQANQQLSAEKEKIARQLQEQLGTQLKELEAENEERKKENQRLKEQELQFKRREKALKEQEESLKYQMEEELLQREQEIESQAMAKLEIKFELERKKLQKQIDDSAKLAEEMKRKAEQGSMQLQGEVQELVLETMLAEAFPFDTIEPVPKGVKGADCIQVVLNPAQKDCGKIIYESKNTKEWNDEWLKKLKSDQALVKADLAVIVSKTLPKGQQRFDLLDGVWVCGLSEARAVALALRESLLKVQAVKSAQENKGDKQSLLYEYFTGNEFAQRVQSLLDLFVEQSTQLTKEKEAMQRLWSKREAQIWSMQQNLAGMFGSIEGIAGKQLPGSSVLELE